jgi:hypothetical protein
VKLISRASDSIQKLRGVWYELSERDSASRPTNVGCDIFASKVTKLTATLFAVSRSIEEPGLHPMSSRYSASKLSYIDFHAMMNDRIASTTPAHLRVNGEAIVQCIKLLKNA